MKKAVTLVICFLAVINVFAIGSALPTHSHDKRSERFVHCLSSTHRYSHNNSISKLVYTPGNNASSFEFVWQFTINNPILNVSSTPRPSVIVTPVHESQIQTVIYCAKKHGLELRIRCGGHDFEGNSYTARVPFVMLDLINMRSITVDPVAKTAWVQGGASLGELYYRISQSSNTLGFPAGVWSTVGVGGLISGGGYGALLRKYGLAGDNVLDARLIDADGRILDRKAMGEDLFWAIRGGGGSSFGVIVAWKLRLVDVPEIVTVFTISRTIEQNATTLFHKWQWVAPNFDRDLFMRVQLNSENILGSTTKKTVRVSFEASFQGRVDRLLSLMNESFPELGLTRQDCTEMRWIQSALVFSGFSSKQSPDILLNRTAPPRFSLKGKSDYIVKPIPISGVEGMWRMFFQNDVGTEFFVLNPYGGRMSEISESAIPFPHRAGNLYMMLQGVVLDAARPDVTSRRVKWLERFNRYMARYVSRSPRRSYLNYNDFDLGVGSRTYGEASIWGERYFNKNFKRLVQIKAKADPHNFFRHTQSIPPFPSV